MHATAASGNYLIERMIMTGVPTVRNLMKPFQSYVTRSPRLFCVPMNLWRSKDGKPQAVEAVWWFDSGLSKDIDLTTSPASSHALQ